MNITEANATNAVLRALLNPRGQRTPEEQANLARAAELLADRAQHALHAGIAPHEVRRFFGTEQS